MSILSEKLNEYLYSKKMTAYQLAQSCPFENATLYQYLSGKRPLKKKEHLNTIMSLLKLTPEEIEDVMCAYEIQLIGIDLYSQRKQVKELVFSLQTIGEYSKAIHHDSSKKIEFHFAKDSQVIYGELEVNRIAYAIIQYAYQTGSAINLFLPPQQEILLHGLIFLENDSFSAVQPQITHIICLESDNIKGCILNLERMQQVLKYGIAVKSYRPLYFYGQSSEHFSSTNILPGLILTEQAAMQISSNGRQAILHTQPQMSALFKNLFTQIEFLCKPLMMDNINFIRKLELEMQCAQETALKKSYKMSSDISSILFWNEELLRTYINPNLLNYEQTITQYIQYLNKLYEVSSKGDTTILLKPSFVLEFIQTGILTLKEYPQIFLRKPFSPSDRKGLLVSVLSACKQGWYHIQFVEDSCFPLDYHWEFEARKNNGVLFQYFDKDIFYIFDFDEPGIVYAFYDYLENLSKSNCVMSPEASETLLRQWIKKYL